MSKLSTRWIPHNESSFSNWIRSSYSESLRHLTYLVERRWTSARSLISFFNHGRQAWNEYSKWEWMNAPYGLWKSAVMISMNDAFISLIIEFAFFAAYIRTHVCVFLLSVKKRVFELSRVWPWRWPLGGTPYMVFIGPVFHNTTKTCLKRKRHGGF